MTQREVEIEFTKTVRESEKDDLFICDSCGRECENPITMRHSPWENRASSSWQGWENDGVEDIDDLHYCSRRCLDSTRSPSTSGADGDSEGRFEKVLGWFL